MQFNAEAGPPEVKKAPIEPPVRFQLKIRVYGAGHQTHESHSYLMDDLPMGVSAPVHEMSVNVRELTLHELRPILMYEMRGAMKKRSMIWQEVLFVMKRLPNVYNRPKADITQFQFGFAKKSNLQEIMLIPVSSEKRSIASLVGAIEYFEHDLVIVPLSQLPPDTSTNKFIKNDENKGNSNNNGNDAVEEGGKEDKENGGEETTDSPLKAGGTSTTESPTKDGDQSSPTKEKKKKKKKVTLTTPDA